MGCLAHVATPPLIIYLPNAPYSAYFNGTTLTWAGGNVTDDVVANGVALATPGLLYISYLELEHMPRLAVSPTGRASGSASLALMTEGQQRT
jgi:hypothetical protein